MRPGITMPAIINFIHGPGNILPTHFGLGNILPTHFGPGNIEPTHFGPGNILPTGVFLSHKYSTVHLTQ